MWRRRAWGCHWAAPRVVDWRSSGVLRLRAPAPRCVTSANTGSPFEVATPTHARLKYGLAVWIASDRCDRKRLRLAAVAPVSNRYNHHLVSEVARFVRLAALQVIAGDRLRSDRLRSDRWRSLAIACDRVIARDRLRSLAIASGRVLTPFVIARGRSPRALWAPCRHLQGVPR